MKCPHCSAVIEDNAKFCPLCGGKISPETTPQNEGRQASGNYEIYPGFRAVSTNGGAEAFTVKDAGQVQPGGVKDSLQTQPPLKWYKFIIYFQLFANAVVNFVNGVNYITGGVYAASGVPAQDIYAHYGSGLKICDLIMGIACVALALFALYVRQRLAKFRKGAPKLYYVVLWGGAAATLCYSLVVTSLTGINVVGDALSSGVGNIILLICNIIYFKKREHLFVN